MENLSGSGNWYNKETGLSKQINDVNIEHSSITSKELESLIKKIEIIQNEIEKLRAKKPLKPLNDAEISLRLVNNSLKNLKN